MLRLLLLLDIKYLLWEKDVVDGEETWKKPASSVGPWLPGWTFSAPLNVLLSEWPPTTDVLPVFLILSSWLPTEGTDWGALYSPWTCSSPGSTGWDLRPTNSFGLYEKV